MYELTGLNARWSQANTGIGRADTSVLSELTQFGVGSGPSARMLTNFEPSDTADGSGELLSRWFLNNLHYFISLHAPLNRRCTREG